MYTKYVSTSGQAKSTQFQRTQTEIALKRTKIIYVLEQINNILKELYVILSILANTSKKLNCRIPRDRGPGLSLNTPDLLPSSCCMCKGRCRDMCCACDPRLDRFNSNTLMSASFVRRTDQDLISNDRSAHVTSVHTREHNIVSARDAHVFLSNVSMTHPGGQAGARASASSAQAVDVGLHSGRSGEDDDELEASVTYMLNSRPHSDSDATPTYPSHSHSEDVTYVATPGVTESDDHQLQTPVRSPSKAPTPSVPSSTVHGPTGTSSYTELRECMQTTAGYARIWRLGYMYLSSQV